MATQVQTSIARKKLRARIKGFYDHLNKMEWESCYQFLDPALRADGIDNETYVRSLTSFFHHFGPITIKLAELNLFLGVKNKGFGNRDFAYGLLVWHDKRHEPHLLKERWVKADGNWYTRMSGLVVNQSKKVAAADLSPPEAA
jgi:hypothetical protein